MSYTQATLNEAIHALVGDGGIQDRLFYAGQFLAKLHQSDDFPDALNAEFKGIKDALTKVTPTNEGEGSLRATHR